MVSAFYFTVTELTTDPVATVPPDPGANVTTPALVTDPASDPAVPDAWEVTSEKLGIAPVLAAEVGTASPVVRD